MIAAFGRKTKFLTPDYLQLAPFCRYFSFVAASSSSFSKIVFLRCCHFGLGVLATCHDRYGPFAAYAALPTKTPRFRKSGAVGEVIKAFVAGARVLAGCCRLGAGVPIFYFIFSYCAWLWALGLGTPEKANTAAWRQIKFPL